MRKPRLYFVMAAFLLIGSTLSVYAEEYTIGDNWKTQFADGKMTANFDAEEIRQAVGSLQPGDQVTIRLTLENQDPKSADWYMSSEVLESLEDSNSSASGGAYTYDLSYTDSKGAVTALYTSDSVGGEGDTSAGIGLHEVSSALEEFFYLDRLESGASGVISLSITLDGESQGNNYQNTLARLQMSFAADPVTGLGGGSGSGSGGSGGNSGNQEDDSSGGGTPGMQPSVAYTLGSVQTGDQSPLMFWSLLALLAGVGLMLFGWIVSRKKRGEEA
ncbi:MAG: hypothetical protein HFI92_11755 [Lachnospiraceae bacterium]|nr:hypothetical protein [Lachnospiraceae bacterium]